MVAAAACERKADPAAATEPLAPRDVAVVVVEQQAWPRTVRVPGDLLADEEALLATKVAGRVAAVHVDLGTRVETGAPLVELEVRDFELRALQSEAALEAARARLGLAGERDVEGGAFDPDVVPIVVRARSEHDDALRERDRIAGLLRDGVASQSALDSAQARLQSAQGALADALHEVASRRAIVEQRRAELALARQQLADATIRAPFTGAVAQRLVQRGEYVAAGDAVAKLVRFDPVRLSIVAPAGAAAALRPGLRVRFTPAPGAPPREAALVRVAPELDARTRSRRAEAELENGDGALAPGTFVDAELVIDPEARALALPRDALVRFAGVDRVLLVRDGRIAEQVVEVGRADARRVEIVAGLAAGDAVVREPGGLRAGDPVRVVP